MCTGESEIPGSGEHLDLSVMVVRLTASPGVCLSCEEEKIRAMLQRSRQISYTAARRAIGPAVLDAWALSFESVVALTGRGLQLKGTPMSPSIAAVMTYCPASTSSMSAFVTS